MIEINPLLSFSDLDGCRACGERHITLIHACKDPCHRSAAAYQGKSLPADNPHYLAVEKDNHLYLNLIDPPVPLFQRRSFELFFSFLDRQPKDRPVLIHCNKGESRAPSLTLLYMAKRLGLLRDDSYGAARTAFEALYPYKPGKGIAEFMEQNWAVLG